jgi:hypothetical protein
VLLDAFACETGDCGGGLEDDVTCGLPCSMKAAKAARMASSSSSSSTVPVDSATDAEDMV